MCDSAGAVQGATVGQPCPIGGGGPDPLLAELALEQRQLVA
jgi:hypothetical protein